MSELGDELVKEKTAASVATTGADTVGIETLVFVYNADSGMMNLAKDVLHKLLSPSTYPCSLCDLTYSALGERRSWVRFRKQLNVMQAYLHKDEFVAEYQHTQGWKPSFTSLDYPGIFAVKGGDVTLVATKQQLDGCASLPELKSLVLSLLD